MPDVSHDDDILRYNLAIDRLAHHARSRLYGRQIVMGPDDSAIAVIAQIWNMPTTQIRDAVLTRLGGLLKGES